MASQYAFRFWFSLCAITATSVTAYGADLEPMLGERGKLLLDETFSGAELPSGWTRNAGNLRVADGVLRINEVAADKHVAAKLLHFGYDPASGEVKSKGHLFTVAITPTSWSLTENLGKNQTIAEAPATFDAGRWYTLLIECRGDEVAAQAAGGPPLKGHAPDFHVKKPGLVFRAGGAEDQSVLIDNLRVWELQ
jgi:hypothetical protein